MAGWVLHVDLDQFIAAVEILRRPDLHGRAIVVGGDGDPTKRGVVATASYEARAFGVNSGTPLRIAARKCPDATFLPVDKPAYEAASEQVMNSLRSLGFPVEVAGWDEAFVSTGTDEPERLAQRIRVRIRHETRLECSVGIGGNMLQAKLATGFAKPGGVFRITDETWLPLLGDRPTDALWGIGRKTARRLTELGIETVRELAATDPRRLVAAFGQLSGPWLVQLATGQGRSTLSDTPHVARSRSRETTFQENLADWADVRREVLRLTRQVLDDIAAEERPVARVIVKIRYAPFTTRSHSRALPSPSTSAELVEEAARVALDRFETGRPVRLVGVRAELVPARRC